MNTCKRALAAPSSSRSLFVGPCTCVRNKANDFWESCPTHASGDPDVDRGALDLEKKNPMILLFLTHFANMFKSARQQRNSLGQSPGPLPYVRHGMD